MYAFLYACKHILLFVISHKTRKTNTNALLEEEKQNSLHTKKNCDQNITLAVNVMEFDGNKRLQLAFFVLKRHFDKRFYFVVADDQSKQK